MVCHSVEVIWRVCRGSQECTSHSRPSSNLRRRSPGSNPLGRRLVYRLVSEKHLFRGMPTGPEALFEPPGMFGLWSSARSYLKIMLCAKLVRSVRHMTNKANILNAFGGGISLGCGCLTWVPRKPSIHVPWPTILELQEAMP